MRKKINILLILIINLIFIIKVEGLSVSNNNITLGKNDSSEVEVYTQTDKNIVKIDFDLTYSTYDIPASFKINSIYTLSSRSGIHYTMDLNGIQTGNIYLGNISIYTKSDLSDLYGTITISNVKATLDTGDIIALNNQRINVKIDNNYISNSKVSNLLKSIESNIVKIDLVDGVYEYYVEVDDTVNELDLNPIPKEDSYTVNISSQDITDNTSIEIDVSDSNSLEKYIINVGIKKDDIGIDNTVFSANYTYKNKIIIISIVLFIVLIGSLILSRRKVK